MGFVLIRRRLGPGEGDALGRTVRTPGVWWACAGLGPTELTNFVPFSGLWARGFYGLRPGFCLELSYIRLAVYNIPNARSYCNVYRRSGYQPCSVKLLLRRVIFSLADKITV